MPSSMRLPRDLLSSSPHHAYQRYMQLTFLVPAVLFLLFTLPVKAGGSGSKPVDEIVEDEIRRHVVGLVPVFQEEGIIKTKSQKPIRPRPHNATIIEASASPLRRECFGKEEGVFAQFPDTRVRADQTGVWPHSAHGVVSMRFPSMPDDLIAWGTGALISSTVVLTCAHNLYSHDYREQASEVRFFPAINSKSLPFGEPKVIEWYYSPAYQETRMEDYGILILDRPLGEETGYLGLSVLPPEALKILTLSVTGYPRDKVIGKEGQYEMWGMEGPVYNIDPEHISYEIQTYGGQSGSPVCYKDGDDYRIVGIHILPDLALRVNKATLLTKARYGQINRWVTESLRKRLKAIAVEGVQTINFFKKALGEPGIRALVQYHLPKLTRLRIDSNNIGDAGAVHLARLQSLTDLDISWNNIGDAGAIHLARLQNLTNLTIQANKIGEAGAACLANLQNLIRLIIWQNNIGDVGAAHLARLQKLTDLSIAWNSIGDAGAAHLARLQNLKKLGIEENNIGDVGAAHLAKLQNLTCLDIWQNNVGDVGAAHLARLQNLTHLNIWRNKVGDAGAAHLARLQNLISLDISGNNIGDAGAAHLARLQNLTDLNIGWNKIGDAGVAHLARLQSLTQLHIEKNKIGDVGRQVLQAARFVDRDSGVFRRYLRIAAAVVEGAAVEAKDDSPDKKAP